MRKLVLFICGLVLAGTTFAQLAGTKNIPGSGGTNDYPTIAAAIADLNLQGVGPGGVTFNIAAGYSETFSSPTAGWITATGSSSSPVIFQKSGTGANPLITAGTGVSATVDGIIVIAGGDYITFDGISLAENAMNTYPTTQMEWGFAMVKARNTVPVDGCQYITIQNCSITLNASNAASVGIYSGSHTTASTSAISQANLSGPSDLLNNCRFYNNSISNVVRGFSLNGFNDATGAMFDQNNEIGALGQGNMIFNIGASNHTTYGIYSSYQTNLSIAYNSITGGSTTGSLQGITPRVSTNPDIHHNQISIGNSSGTSSVYGIDCYAAGFPGFTVNVHHNTIQNCFNLGTGSFTGIAGGNGAGSVMNIYSNTLTANTCVNGTLTLVDGGTATQNNIYNNIISGNTKTGPGTMICLRSMYYGVNIYNNQAFSNSIALASAATSGSTLTGIAANLNAQTTENIYGNLVYDLNITGLTTSTSAITNTINGIYTETPSTCLRNWYNNTVRNLTANVNNSYGSNVVYGLRIGSSQLSNIYKNQVFNLTASTATDVIHGFSIGGGTQTYVYNNFISDLKTPMATSLNAISGLSVTGGTNAGIYFNTIYLNAASSGTTFGTSGIFKSGATTTIDLRNNVIMNLSTPGISGGATVAYRWSGAYNPIYYSASSNTNNFYAGPPSANRLIYNDGTNSDMLIADYQTRVYPMEANSFTENSPLINSTTVPYDLHMNGMIPSLCEGSGMPVTIPSITDDFDGNPRSTSPDVGADEFAGIPAGVGNPVGFAATASSSQQVDLTFGLNSSGNQVIIVWNTSGYFTTPSGPPPTTGSSFAGGTVLYTGTSSPVNHTGLTGGTTIYYKGYSYNGTSYSSGVPVSTSTILAPPSGLIGYAMSTSDIDLFWTKNTLNNNVIVVVNTSSTFGQPVNGTSYLPGDALPTAGTVIYTGPLSGFSHNMLTIGTRYYYKAWSYDAFGWYSTSGATCNVTTMACAPTSTLPFTEGFESYTPPAVGCGTLIDGNGDGIVWGSKSVTGTAPHSGTKVLAIATGAIQDNDWYFIRGLNLEAGKTYQLTFFYRAQYTYPAAEFEVRWGTSPTPSGMFSPALFTIVTPSSFTPYPQATVNVTPTSTGTYYFGWHSTNPPNGNSPYIDDITISTNPCAAPLTVSATNVTTGSADISWTGTAPNVEIDYGSAGHTAGTGTIVATSANPITISGLAPSTAYDVYIRQNCGSGSYSFWTGPVSFTTPYLAPVVNTGSATALTGTGATLDGTIHPNGLATTAYFEYGLTTGYGSVAAATPSPITAGSGTTTITATLTGLIANSATYHYRAVGYNTGTYTYGADQTFTTPPALPMVTTTSATSLSTSGATLNGTVNANNASTSVTFEYGLTDTYGATATATDSPVNGNFTVTASAGITGLLPYTVYHYRVNATNASGTVNGADMTFTTAELPDVTTGPSVWTPATTNGTIVFNGTVNANTYTSTVTFEYGLTTTFGSSVNGIPATVTGTTATSITTAATTLSTTNLNALIYYRTKAVHPAGTAYGATMTMTTPIVPVATTNAATMNANGVTIGGNVNPNNSPTYISYEYGTTTDYGSTVQFATNPVTGTSGSNRTYIFVPGSLSPGTLYNYRVVATNAAGTVYGANITFTTPPMPVSTTLAATLVTSTTARLNGTVLTNTTSGTNFRFEYGLTPLFGTVGTPTPSSSATNSTVTTILNLTGLMPNTTYYYRVYGVNAAGTAYGATMTFTTTAVVPTVTTLAAYGITPNGAVLNGTVNPNNAVTTVTYEYGLTTAYGSTLTAPQSPVSGGVAVGVNTPLTGLLPNTTYHYRVAGTNSTGTSNGANMTFTTLPIPPTVTTDPASAITATSGTVNGTVNANNLATTLTFEYGLTTAYGSTASAIPGTVTGTSSTAVSLPLTGLAINTTYHYRLVGVNSQGTTSGADQQFTTNCIEPVININGPAAVCAGATGVIYMTETGMSGYAWSVSAGGTITYGQGTSFIMVDWNTSGPQSVSLSYVDTHGCTVSAPVVFQVTVAQPFAVGAISANQSIGYHTVPAPLAGIAPTGGLAPYTYQWQSSLNGTDFNDIAGATDLDYAPGMLLSTTHYRQLQSGSGNCGSGITNMVTITVGLPIPATVSLQGISVASGESNCYNAYETIYIAGSGTTFTVQNGGSATMIAGLNIIYYPGTTVEPGGYMHGFIAPNGPWCSQPNPVVNNNEKSGDVEAVVPEITAGQVIRVYPNPTPGNFALEMAGSSDATLQSVEIYSVSGMKVAEVKLNGERRHEFPGTELRQGVYFLHVTTTLGKTTVKLIRL